ncbi:tyrosinase family protein [Streptomyces sp. NPDC047821]|uniref:tyrosinase family protein n=1 Tax=Streptomyces sp. NPDC047821 TaxID=3365488 RepID=UPI003714711D
MVTFVRQDASRLAAWDPALYWYARGVGRMQQRPDTDPTSWVFQGCIHGVPPAVTETHEAFNQCPHGGWFFLPWHRGYVYYFERIVRAAIKEIAADEGITPDPSATWALPYWNYALDAPDPNPIEDFTSRALPEAFRTPKMPASPEAVELTVDNPLYVPDAQVPPAAFWNAPHRALGKNSAFEVLPYTDVNPFRAMSQTFFSATRSRQSVQPSFGSEISYTSMDHFRRGFGELENVPHNQVHGGVGGWMGSVRGAARDPIFWLHHSNIDRLWSSWLSRDNRTPDDTSWLDHQFMFFDENGDIQRPTPRDFLGIEPVDYAYDALTDGTGTQPAVVPPAPLTQAGERVLATANPRQVLSVHGPTEVSLEPVGDAGRAMEAATAGDVPEAGLILTVHGVRTDVPPGTPFHVFLNNPGGELDPAGPYFVGWISFFGAADVDGDLHDHGGHDVSFDVTDQVRRLREQGLLPDGPVTVSIVPSIPVPAAESARAAAAEAADPQPSFERVSLTTA